MDASIGMKPEPCIFRSLSSVQIGDEVVDFFYVYKPSHVDGQTDIIGEYSTLPTRPNLCPRPLDQDSDLIVFSSRDNDTWFSLT